MKKVVLVLVLLFVLAVGALLSAPSLIDWNKYKQDMSAKVKEVIGKDIIIQGNLDLSIFPSATINTGKVIIPNKEGGSAPNMMELEGVSIKIDLMSLLKGRLDIQHVSLKTPKIVIDEQADGSLNWTFPAIEKAKQTGDGSRVAFSSITIENSTVIYHNLARKSSETLEGVNAEINAESLIGPFRIEGNGRYKGVPSGFAISIEKLQNNAPYNFNVALSQAEAKAFLGFSGTKTVDKNSFNLKGDVSFNVQEPDKLIPFIWPNETMAPELAMPFAVNMTINGDSKQYKLTDLVLKYGENAAAGIGEYNAGTKGDNNHLRLQLQFAKIVSDNFVTYAKRYLEQNKRHELNMKLPQYTDIEFMALISLINYKDASIRDSSLNIAIDKGNLFINELKSFLPGNSSLSITGQTDLKSETPSFSGRLAFDTQNFKNVMSWLNIGSADDKTIGFRDAGIDTDFTISDNAVIIPNAKIKFDKTKAELALNMLRNDRPTMGLSLKVDEINFDGYKQSDKKETATNFIDAWGALFKQASFLKDYDANVSLSINNLVYANVPLLYLTTDFSLLNGNANFTSFKVSNVAGASVNIAGGLSGFGSDNISTQNLGFEISSENPKYVLSRLNIEPKAFDISKFGQTSFKGIINGDKNNLGSDILLQSSGLYWHIKGSSTKSDVGYKYDFISDLRSNEFLDFVHLFEPTYVPRSTNLGIFKMVNRISGTKNELALSSTDLFIGAINYKGLITLNTINPKAKITLDGRLNEIDISKFFPKNMTFASLEKASKLASSQTSNPQLILTSSLPKSIIEAPLNKHPWFNNVAVFKNILLRKPSTVAGDLDLSFLGLIDADVTLSSGKITYGDKNIINSSVKFLLNNKLLQINELKGIYKEGKIDINCTLDARDTTSFIGNLTLEKAKSDQPLLGSPLYDISDTSYDLTLKWDTKGKSLREFNQKAVANASYKFYGGKIKGINLDILREKILNKKSSDGTVSMLQENLEQGSSNFDSMEAILDINNGIIRSNDIKIDFPQATASLIFITDTNKWEVEAKSQISFKNQEIIPPINLALKGSMESPDIMYEASDLERYFAQIEEKIKAGELAQRQAESSEKLSMIDARKSEAVKSLDNIKAINDKANALIGEYKNSSIEAEVANLKSYIEQSEQAIKEIEKVINGNTIYTFKEVEASDIQKSMVENLAYNADISLKKIDLMVKKLDLQDKYNEIYSISAETKTIFANISNAIIDATKKVKAESDNLEIPTDYNDRLEKIRNNDNSITRYLNSAKTMLTESADESSIDKVKLFLTEVDSSINDVMSLKNAIDMEKDYINKNIDKDAESIVAKEKERKRIEEEKRKAEEAARLKAEEEKKAEEERKRLEEEKRKAEEEARKKAEEAAKIAAEAKIKTATGAIIKPLSAGEAAKAQEKKAEPAPAPKEEPVEEEAKVGGTLNIGGKKIKF